MSPSTLPLPLHVLLPGHFDGWLAAQPAAVQAWVRAQGFTGAPGTLLSIPGADGMAGAAIGVGDALDPAIMAASILAKVARDHWMVALDAQFPQYGFAVHKGYPTPAHLAALAEHGPCPQHRRSFAPVRAALQAND